MLKINDIHVYYGAIHAIKGVSLDVPAGSVVTLIGANGAGKTTILRTISGLLSPREGSVHFEGEDTGKTKAQDLVRRGLVQVPEGRRIFAPLTVQDNLELGAYLRKDKGKIKEDMDNVFARFPRLEERKSQLAGTLSGGEQQMLAMGRALMSNPRVLLLDEPSMGLAPLLVEEIFRIVEELNKAGITILLVEQNAKMALSVANYGYVLETGKIVASGPAAELAASEEIKKAYLGG